MSDAPTASSLRIHHLWIDALRGFAALSVVMFHLIGMLPLDLPTTLPLGWFRAGFWGVDLFFAISGAVMVLSTARLRESYGPRWRGEFVRRRLARILPLYVLTSAAYLLLVQPELLAADGLAWNLASHALFVHNLFPQTHGALNGPSWSLGVEMQFYLLVLVAAGWLLRVRLRWLLLAGLVLDVGWRLWHWNALVRGQAEPDLLPVFFAMSQLPGVYAAFTAGMVAARWAQEKPVPAGSRAHWLLAAAALLAWAGAAQFNSTQGLAYWTELSGVLGCHLLVATAAGSSVLWALRAPPPVRLLGLLRWLGNSSYGVYLWHMGVLLLVQRHWPQPPSWQAALILLLTLLLSTLAWHLVERPLIRLAGRSAVAG